MKTKILLTQFVIVFLLCLVRASLFAQNTPLPKQWDVRFGGTGLEDNNSRSVTTVRQTHDGGYIIGGSSSSDKSGDKTQNSRGGFDYWVIKTDAKGTKIWDSAYGGNQDDFLTCLQPTKDGGYILGGYSSSPISGEKTQSSRGSTDYWIVKIDSTGKKKWDKRFGGINQDELYSIQQTLDAGYILGGYSLSNKGGDKGDNSYGGWDYWVIKIDSNGNRSSGTWDETFGGNSDDFLRSIAQTRDGGYILGGYSTSGVSGNKVSQNFGQGDFWIIKLEGNGVKDWERDTGFSINESLYSICQTEDDGYLLGGWINGGDGHTDYWIWKTFYNGDPDWGPINYGGNNNEILYEVQRDTVNGGYILAGQSNSGANGWRTVDNKGGIDYWIVKIDDNGSKLWDQAFGGAKDDELTSIQQTRDGGFILGGVSISDSGEDKSQNNWSKDTADYWMVKVQPCSNPQKYFRDADGDGYGNIFDTILSCTPLSGYVSDSTDCNDNNVNIHPNATELCNGIDDNCNGLVDENTIPVNITPTGTVDICKGASVLLTANSNSGISYLWFKNQDSIIKATKQTYIAKQVGSYKVREKNSIGCYGFSDSTIVVVHPLPKATITPLGNLNICSTGSVILEANGGTGNSYKWIKDGNYLAGATKRKYTATSAGTYQVEVTSIYGCINTSASVTVTKPCNPLLSNSYSELKNSQNKFTLYPNPTTGIITVQYNSINSGKIALNIYDAIGQKVFTQSNTTMKGNNVYRVNLSNVAAGIYYFELINNNEKNRIKFAIEK